MSKLDRGQECAVGIASAQRSIGYWLLTGKLLFDSYLDSRAPGS